MRGSDIRTGELFSYVDLEQRVPENHPLRLIRRIVNEVLVALDGQLGRYMRLTDGPRSPPSGCCERFCCRRSTASARSAS
jgi:hypothetical protein